MKVCSFNECNNNITVKYGPSGRASNNRQHLCDSCYADSKAYRSRDGVGTIFSEMVGRARNRSKERNMSCDLTPEYLASIWPTDWKCPIFNVPFKASIGSGPAKYSASLDKIVPSKGYVQGNVQVISKLANSMKQNATEEELIEFAKAVLEGKCI